MNHTPATGPTGKPVKISAEKIDISCPEPETYHRLLALDGKHILGLGCGSAAITRDIATSGADRKITALEVDEIAHEANLQIRDLPNVSFGLSGAEDIPLEDESVDVVFMFKSLHHVPVALMDQSMREIRRVLKPGGMASISEPVFAGEFNEILQLFHDEREVREAAFSAVERAVDAGLFGLVEEVFINSPMVFESVADFERRIIRATHTAHRLDEKRYNRVKQRLKCMPAMRVRTSCKRIQSGRPSGMAQAGLRTTTRPCLLTGHHANGGARGRSHDGRRGVWERGL